jgi:NmrA-like family
MVPPSDCGEVIHQMFLHPKEFIGRWVGMAADRLTVQQVADIFTKKLGRKFVPGTVSAANEVYFNEVGPYVGGNYVTIVYFPGSVRP